MRILLTGGAGYIGTHTCVELLAEGHEVVVADNFVNSKPMAIERVEQISGKKVTLYEADITDAAQLEPIFEKEQIDAVIHLAGLKAVGESKEKPVLYYRTNLDATFTLLETMKKFGVKKLIFSSSATVYGVPEKVPLTEEMPTHTTSNPYGWTKLMIEQILRDVSYADPELSIVLLRYFNPIGAHESGMIGEDPNGIPNNLLPNVLNAACGKVPCLQLNGDDYPTRDGTCVRDYIHVVDLAKGHVKALGYACANKGVEPFNLGVGDGCSVLDIIHAFEKANGVPVPYKIAPRRPGDVPECYADPSKAERILGWKAEKTLEQMCRDAWNWRQKNPNGYEN